MPIAREAPDSWRSPRTRWPPARLPGDPGAGQRHARAPHPGRSSGSRALRLGRFPLSAASRHSAGVFWRRSFSYTAAGQPRLLAGFPASAPGSSRSTRTSRNISVSHRRVTTRGRSALEGAQWWGPLMLARPARPQVLSLDDRADAVQLPQGEAGEVGRGRFPARRRHTDLKDLCQMLLNDYRTNRAAVAGAHRSGAHALQRASRQHADLRPDHGSDHRRPWPHARPPPLSTPRSTGSWPRSSGCSGSARSRARSLSGPKSRCFRKTTPPARQP